MHEDFVGEDEAVGGTGLHGVHCGEQDPIVGGVQGCLIALAGYRTLFGCPPYLQTLRVMMVED